MAGLRPMKGRKSGSAGHGGEGEARGSVFAKDGEARGSVFAKDREARERRAGESVREKYQRAAQQVLDAGDHVDRALAQWSREMPEIEIKGADVLNRARRLTLETRRDIEANFKRHGLDSGEFDVLATLRRSGEPYALRPTELYQSLMISSGGLTARLDRLEAAGLIRPRAHEDDARRVRV